MDFSDVSVFKVAGARLDYLSQRQRLIAQNVVNANTPGYSARDLKPFDTVMGVVKPVVAARTSPTHLVGFHAGRAAGEARKPDTWEVSPDGNGVSLEQEMTKGADTREAFALTTGIFQRNVQLLRAAWRGSNG